MENLEAYGKGDFKNMQNKMHILHPWVFLSSLSLWITIITLFVFVFGYSKSPYLLFIITPFYIFYLILACCSDVSKGLLNKDTHDNVTTYLESMRTATVCAKIHAEAYHNRVHHHTTRDSKGNVRHTTHTEKVVTWSHTETMWFNSVIDYSKRFYHLLEYGFDNVLINFVQVIRMDAHSREQINIERNRLLNIARSRDVHHNISEREEITNFKSSIFSYDLNKQTIWKQILYSKITLIICVLLGVGWFHQLFFECNIIRVNHSWVKECSFLQPTVVVLPNDQNQPELPPVQHQGFIMQNFEIQGEETQDLEKITVKDIPAFAQNQFE